MGNLVNLLVVQAAQLRRLVAGADKALHLCDQPTDDGEFRIRFGCGPSFVSLRSFDA
jgi:hypothetical protein